MKGVTHFDRSKAAGTRWTTGRICVHLASVTRNGFAFQYSRPASMTSFASFTTVRLIAVAGATSTPQRATVTAAYCTAFARRYVPYAQREC